MGSVGFQQFFFSSTIGQVPDVYSQQSALRVWLQVHQIVQNNFLLPPHLLLLLRLIRVHPRPAEFSLEGITITLTLTLTLNIIL